MLYKVKVIEEIRYNIIFEVEADSEEEATNIVTDDILEGDIIDEEVTYFDITDIQEIK
jgi:DNA-binding Lrp family transcriptional regulator